MQDCSGLRTGFVKQRGSIVKTIEINLDAQERGYMDGREYFVCFKGSIEHIYLLKRKCRARDEIVGKIIERKK